MELSTTTQRRCAPHFLEQVLPRLRGVEITIAGRTLPAPYALACLFRRRGRRLSGMARLAARSRLAVSLRCGGGTGLRISMPSRSGSGSSTPLGCAWCMTSRPAADHDRRRRAVLRQPSASSSRTISWRTGCDEPPGSSSRMLPLGRRAGITGECSAHRRRCGSVATASAWWNILQVAVLLGECDAAPGEARCPVRIAQLQRTGGLIEQDGPGERRAAEGLGGITSGLEPRIGFGRIRRQVRTPSLRPISASSHG